MAEQFDLDSSRSNIAESATSPFPHHPSYFVDMLQKIEPYLYATQLSIVKIDSSRLKKLLQSSLSNAST